ncbi:hypothetical protein K505DRAFT_102684 [Melanomma pulvis-pyrius CBS 109.77]|uniref:Uncharacterized protein n=1 Tax=Melanomma pulvis-pyrius CBS 109.77 TaxID=1314802 RepID=A0A6A6XQ80_9PLEO|nr:hypothetical protein K505DRAFT_102684 [Melanomma pulvis-pyrius CBS 109.77]
MSCTHFSPAYPDHKAVAPRCCRQLPTRFIQSMFNAPHLHNTQLVALHRRATLGILAPGIRQRGSFIWMVIFLYWTPIDVVMGCFIFMTAQRCKDLLWRARAVRNA